MTENEKFRQYCINDDSIKYEIDKVKEEVLLSLKEIIDVFDDLENNDNYTILDILDETAISLGSLKESVIYRIDNIDELIDNEKSIDKGIKVYYDDKEEEYMLK